MPTPQKGMSLIECLIVAATTCVIVISFQTLNQAIQDYRHTAASNQWLGIINAAREMAIRTKSTISLCPGDQACIDTPHWANSTLIFSDNNANGLLDSGEPLIQAIPLEDNISWQWRGFRSTRALTFDASGTTLAMNGTFTLCQAGKATRKLVINRAGRARIERTPTIPCP